MTDEKQKFIDFMTTEENSKEIENIFSDFKKIFYEVKLGYDHALVLKNTENGKKWMSSTNNIKQREDHLKKQLKNNRDDWYEPWVITFGDLGDDILDKITFDPFPDIGKMPNKEFIDMTIPKNQVENVKKMFIKLTAEYIKVDHASKGKEIRQLIDDHFNSNMKQESIRTIIQSIDNYLS